MPFAVIRADANPQRAVGVIAARVGVTDWLWTLNSFFKICFSLVVQSHDIAQPPLLAAVRAAALRSLPPGSAAEQGQPPQVFSRRGLNLGGA